MEIQKEKKNKQLNRTQRQNKTYQKPSTIFKITEGSRYVQPNQPFKGFMCCFCRQYRDLYKFAECYHKLVCNQCLQQWVKTQIPKRKIPKCNFIGCNSKMTTQQGSSFTYFSQKTKQKYENMLKIIQIESTVSILNDTQKAIYPCKKVDCGGVFHVKSNICIICSTKHCLLCHNEQHQGKKCPQRSTILGIQNFKSCPFCPNYFQVEQGGCNKFTCNKCNKQFCIHCMKQWTGAEHHLCGNTIPPYKVPFLWLKQLFLKTCDGKNDAQQDKRSQFLFQQFPQKYSQSQKQHQTRKSSSIIQKQN